MDDQGWEEKGEDRRVSRILGILSFKMDIFEADFFERQPIGYRDPNQRVIVQVLKRKGE